MAQHDMNIANDTAAAVRSDLNSALSALVSQSSGATEPATTYANMVWMDTTTNILKMRSAANDAWISLFEIDQSANEAVVAASDYTLFNSIDVSSSTVSVSFDIPSNFKTIRMLVQSFSPVTTGSTLILRVGTAGSGGAVVTTSTYSQVGTNNVNGSVSGSTATTTAFGMTPPILTSFGASGRADFTFTGFNEAGGLPDGLGLYGGVTAGTLPYLSARRLVQVTAGNYNAGRFLCDAGNIGNLKVDLYGIRNG